MTNEKIKSHLITAGVANLIEFGYPYANKENILTDLVYGAFFKSMLENNIGKSTKQVDAVINELINTLNQTK